MVVPVIITLIICLGIPFFLSFKSDDPRRFRRKAVPIGFVVMLAATSFLPHDTGVSHANMDDGSAANAADGESVAPTGPVEAVWCAASEIDLSGYTVVSCLEGSPTATNHMVTKRGSYPAENIFDGDIGTCWQDGVEGNGEGTEISVSLSESCEIQYIVISNGRAATDQLYEENSRVYQMEISTLDHPTKVVELPDENIPIAIKMDDWEMVPTEITFRINSVYPGSKYTDTCISEITFYQ